MPTLPLALFKTFTAEMTDYIVRHIGNYTLIEAAMNDLYQQVIATSGEGARLILDTYDRIGLIGSTSYRLDLDGYAGGAVINIGRRPAAVSLKGELDISAAWISAGGSLTRVEKAGDQALNAGVFVSGLPLTIYVGIPSSGVPQLYDSQVASDILWAYSMTWDGFTLTNFKRLARILPGYTAIEDGIGAPRMIQTFDPETEWLSDVASSADLFVPGAADDNEIGLDGSVEVLGGFVHFARSGANGLQAMLGSNPPDSLLTLELRSEGERWNLQDIEIDASAVPQLVMFSVNAPGIGDKRFVTTVRTFSLARVSVGTGVVSARAFSWGLIVRPLLGTPVPKDTSLIGAL